MEAGQPIFGARLSVDSVLAVNSAAGATSCCAAAVKEVQLSQKRTSSIRLLPWHSPGLKV